MYYVPRGADPDAMQQHATRSDNGKLHPVMNTTHLQCAVLSSSHVGGMLQHGCSAVAHHGCKLALMTLGTHAVILLLRCALSL